MVGLPFYGSGYGTLPLLPSPYKGEEVFEELTAERYLKPPALAKHACNSP
jgi:hypothetical protein